MKIKRITVAAALFCCLTACTDTPKQAAQNTEPAPKPSELIDRMVSHIDAAANPAVELTIDFGIKSPGFAMECKPGAGICSPPKMGPKGNAVAQVVANTLQITVNGKDLKAANPVLYDSLRKYGMNGIISFEDTYTFDPDLSTRLGIRDRITISKGSPMVFSFTGDTATQGEALRFYGAIPGNSACIGFNNCSGTPYTVGVSFAPLSGSCACQGYSVFSNNTNGTGWLIVYMRTQNVIAQPGVGPCIPVDTNWSLGYSSDNFTLAANYIFSDSATAAAVSVPLGSIIPGGTSTNTIYFWPTGWCALSLNLNLPDNTADKK